MRKIFTLVDKGVTGDIITEDRTKGMTKVDEDISQPSDDDDKDIKLGEETGEEAGVKKKATKKEAKRPITDKVAPKGDSGKLLNEMKKAGIRINDLITKLLEKEEKRNLVRPFSLLDFSQAIQATVKKIDKKKIMSFFKCLDSSSNGSISTDELVKIWLEASEMAGNANMYKLLFRHMREIQCSEPISRFETRGYQPEEEVSLKMLKDVFSNLNLPDDYLKQIESEIPKKCKVGEFVEFLKGGGVAAPGRQFKPLSKTEYEKMNSAIKKLLPKEDKNFPKYSRLEDEGGKEMNKAYWDTIFTDEWACWNYCLQAAKDLTGFWRDPEFGPSKGDPHGYRSIVGNESEKPLGMPEE